MADKAWKQFERALGRYFGMRRSPMSGMTVFYGKRHFGRKQIASTTKADLEPFPEDTNPPLIYVEAKYRNNEHGIGFAQMKVLDDARSQAKKEKRGCVAIACFKHAGDHGFGIMIHSDDLDRFVEEYTKSKASREAFYAAHDDLGDGDGGAGPGRCAASSEDASVGGSD